MKTHKIDVVCTAEPDEYATNKNIEVYLDDMKVEGLHFFKMELDTGKPGLVTVEMKMFARPEATNIRFNETQLKAAQT